MPETTNEHDFSDWCFRLEDMHARIPVGDEFTAVIRGHLFVEHVLIHFLTEALPHHDLVQLDRISFNLKVELCAGLGVLPKALIAPMKKINALRNKTAHNLEYKISLNDKLELLDSFDNDAQ